MHTFGYFIVYRSCYRSNNPYAVAFLHIVLCNATPRCVCICDAGKIYQHGAGSQGLRGATNVDLANKRPEGWTVIALLFVFVFFAASLLVLGVNIFGNLFPKLFWVLRYNFLDRAKLFDDIYEIYRYSEDYPGTVAEDNSQGSKLMRSSTDFYQCDLSNSAE